MSKSEKKKVSRIKVIKKNWYKIAAPKLFSFKELGEIYVNTPEKALGRVMSYSLKELTGNIKDQSAYLAFRLVKVDGNVLQTQLVGYELTPSSIKRFVRKNTDRLDDYFVFTTKNSQEVLVKTVIITLHKTKRSVQAKLKRELQKTLQEEIGKGDLDAFIENVVNYKFKSLLQKRMHQIYPVKEAAIRLIKLKETENGAKVVPKTVEISVPSPAEEKAEVVPIS